MGPKMLKILDPRALRALKYGALGTPKCGGLLSHNTDSMGRVQSQD